MPSPFVLRLEKLMYQSTNNQSAESSVFNSLYISFTQSCEQAVIIDMASAHESEAFSLNLFAVKSRLASF
jgi:hypothetical protein